ncbi:MAG TPA: DUF1559 domain-containing protein [Gemmatales bacterium]|nr:DUF1559 domain-containing protein [Gemmatales bacterium]
MRLSNRRLAFGLVELLVVVAILGLLLSLTLAAVQHVREAAARTACAENLRQLGIALHQFHNDHGCFPPARDGQPASRELSWMVAILPYIEQRLLYQQSLAALEQSRWPHLHNPPHEGMAKVIKLLVCPTDSRLLQSHVDPWGRLAGFTSYIGIAGVSFGDPSGRIRLGVIGLECTFADIHDGLSNTIMVGERPPPATLYAGHWYPGARGIGFAPGTHHEDGPNSWLIPGPVYGYEPHPCALGPIFGPGRLDNPCDRYHLWSLHLGGSNMLFADTTVRFMRYSQAATVKAMLSRAGGEPVD